MTYSATMMQTLTNACVGSVSLVCLYNMNIPTCFTTCTHPPLFVAHPHSLTYTPSHTHTYTPSHTHTYTPSHTHSHTHLHTLTCIPSHIYIHALETPSVTVTPSSTAVNRSAAVTLTCEARGSPRPSIIWTKVTDTLEVDRNYINKIEGQPLYVCVCVCVCVCVTDSLFFSLQ